MGILAFLANRKYKNNRPAYYAIAILRELFPDYFCRIQLKLKLKKQNGFDNQAEAEPVNAKTIKMIVS